MDHGAGGWDGGRGTGDGCGRRCPRSGLDEAQDVLLGHPARESGARNGRDVELVLRGDLAHERRGSATQPFLGRSEEHTSELQSRLHLVCRLLLEKKKNKTKVESRHQRILARLLAKIKTIAESVASKA